MTTIAFRSITMFFYQIENLVVLLKLQKDFLIKCCIWTIVNLSKVAESSEIK